MDARTHHAIAIATFNDMPDTFRKGVFGRALERLQPEEWQLYTILPDRVDGDNIVYGFFHSHKFEFDPIKMVPVTVKIGKEVRPKYFKGSAHPVILSYYINIRNRHVEGDDLEVRQLGARMSHYVIDGMTTIWHLWQGDLSDKAHQRSETAIGAQIDSILKKVPGVCPGKFSQSNMFREIARRTEAFYLKWLPFAVQEAQSGKPITGNPKVLDMIKDVKDNLASMWQFVNQHMAKDSKKARLAQNYSVPLSGPIDSKLLMKMSVQEKRQFS